ncbi:MAG: Zn-dependent hydrolase [Bacteroidales bacterium]|nr:Zn-dependent hydrolase [Bacteroidales bacterium]
MKKTIMTLMSLAILTMGASTVNAQKVQKAQEGNNEMKKKVEQYAPFVLKYDIGQLSREEAELVGIFIQIADVMDDIYWEQAFGQDNRKKLRELKDPYMRQFAEIQYGAWDRLDAERPFIPGYGPKPAGANFYPKDMTKEEFEKLDDPMKTSQYTILQRNGKGDLEVIPYHKAYEKYLKRVYELLDKAIELAKDDGLRKYLETRREALSTDNYFESDMMWMDMKDSRLDIVFGPIENYEDALYGYKTAYEAFVLIKDEKWSNDLARFTKMLPELQKQLPCDPKYKKEVPGTESDLNVYDVIYYAGDCNAGSKTIAINLPNDEKVQLKKGSRRLQLKNAMEAKFQNILVPIANLMISKEQLKNIKFDAFFSNVCYHEVAHGLGIKNTVTGKGNVRQALKNQYSAWEEAKADICGLYIVQTLIERGEIKGITVEDAYVTYLAGLLRSVRFGATEAHGIANMMCFNYMQDKGAFTRNKEGKYVVDSKKMRAALESWAALVIKTEGEGDYDAAKAYADKNGKVRPDLAKDLKAIEKANIPLDIRYEQGAKVLGLEQDPKAMEMKNDKKPIKVQNIEYKK